MYFWSCSEEKRRFSPFKSFHCSASKRAGLFRRVSFIELVEKEREGKKISISSYFENGSDSSIRFDWNFCFHPSKRGDDLKAGGGKPGKNDTNFQFMFESFQSNLFFLCVCVCVCPQPSEKSFYRESSEAAVFN